MTSGFGAAVSLVDMLRKAAVRRRTAVAPGATHLHVDLRQDDGGALTLVVRNLGPGDASEVTVDAAGGADRLCSVASLPAGTERSFPLPAGHDAPYLDAVLAWHDAAGPHAPEHRVAAL
jgi:hypothetical protein